VSTPDTSILPGSAFGHHEPDPRRWQALALVCVAFFMTVLDGTIVTVALPSIKNSLHVSDNTLQWVLIAYTITFGGLLLLGGRCPTPSERCSTTSRSRACRWRSRS
jgi:hypothetical protein